MAGGAVVAAAAAAQAQRTQAILDAFRVAGATAPERARPLEELGLGPSVQLDQLIGQGVIVADLRAGTWFLSESALIAKRDAQRPRRIAVAVVAALLALGVGLFAALYSS